MKMASLIVSMVMLTAVSITPDTEYVGSLWGVRTHATVVEQTLMHTTCRVALSLPIGGMVGTVRVKRSTGAVDSSIDAGFDSFLKKTGVVLSRMGVDDHRKTVSIDVTLPVVGTRRIRMRMKNE